MKVRKLGKVLLSLTPLLLAAGPAMAAISGVAQIDAPLNTLGRVAAATGVVVGGVGAVGIIHHVRSGSWMGSIEQYGLATGAGAMVYHYGGIAPSFGGSAAALVHAAVIHPAVHAMAHAALRLVG
jgi:hypothetical protein